MFGPSNAAAQSTGLTEATESTDLYEPGDTISGLPGFVRLGIASTGLTRATFVASGGYGWTEPQTVVDSTDGAHHRLLGAAALGVRPLPWAAGYLRVDARQDRSAPDEFGSDDSSSTELRAGIRFGAKIWKGLTLSPDVSVWFPGGEQAGFASNAVSADFSLLASYVFHDLSLTIGGKVGYRLDRTSQAVESFATLRQGDRIALGVSEFDAIPIGIGASWRTGGFEWLGEFTGDIFIGADAPPFSNSPMRVAVGVRYHFNTRWALQLVEETSIQKRPVVGPMQPLIPIEPRVNVTFGIMYRQPFRPKVEKAMIEEIEEIKAEEAKPKPTVATLAGVLTGASGEPVVGARIELLVNDEVRIGTTDSEGNYAFEYVPIGTAKLRVVATGFETIEQDVEVRADPPAPTQMTMQPLQVTGQLRGLVRDFSGRELRATIRVSPGDHITSADEHGEFTLDLEAGDYTVTIEARGYKSQERKVRMEENGVIIINADLHRDRRRR